MAVYSQDRVTRLRMVLYLVMAIAALLVVFAAFILASANGDDRARRRLRDGRGRRAPRLWGHRPQAAG